MVPQRPSAIEQYLETASSEDRRAILHKLVGVEVELRRARGERPTEQEYVSRFPDEARLVYSAFREVESAESSVADPAAGEDSHPPVERTATHWRRLEDSHHVQSGADRIASTHRYSLINMHAEGGIGEVWLARDHHLGREIALKRLRPENASSRVAQARFLREARVTGQLQHPGIAPVYELSRSSEAEEPFYTMRFINGRTLTEAVRDYHRRRRLGETQPLALRELIGAFLTVCQVIAYAHSRGVIHRDVKGQNVVLGDFGEVMVLDWGLAKVVTEREGKPDGDGQAACPASIDDFAEDSGHETVQGEILGTPSYMSPEQALGRVDLVDERSDIYGLGAILYEILTGEPPFRGSKG